MGKRGSPAKPTALKRAQGNPGKRALNDREPQPRALESGELEPPERLRGDSLAVEAWMAVAPELRRLGLLTVVDRHALEEYCLAFAERCKAEDRIAESGAVMEIETEKGGRYLQRNPWIIIRDAAIKRMNVWGARFGLSPADRARIHATPVEDEDVQRQQSFLRGA